MHWATIRVQVRRTPSTSQAGEFRVKGNTPDFMLEHFIILYCDVTAGTPHRWGGKLSWLGLFSTIHLKMTLAKEKPQKTLKCTMVIF